MLLFVALLLLQISAPVRSQQSAARPYSRPALCSSSRGSTAQWTITDAFTVLLAARGAASSSSSSSSSCFSFSGLSPPTAVGRYDLGVSQLPQLSGGAPSRGASGVIDCRCVAHGLAGGGISLSFQPCRILHHHVITGIDQLPHHGQCEHTWHERTSISLATVACAATPSCAPVPGGPRAPALQRIALLPRVVAILGLLVSSVDSPIVWFDCEWELDG